MVWACDEKRGTLRRKEIKCTTMLHGGVCHRTPTRHKSGNKMREKKKIKYFTKVVKLQCTSWLNKLKKRNYYLAFEPLFSTIISVATIILIDYLDGKVDKIYYYHIKYHDDHCSGLTNYFNILL